MKLDNRFKIEKVVSKDSYRAAICSAYLDKTEPQAKLVATNGHAMAVINVETDQTDTTGLVPPEAFTEARKLSKKFGKFQPSEISANGAVELTNGAKFPRGEEKFPDWKRIPPKAAKTFRVAFNARLLHDLADALGSENGVVSIEFLGDLKGPMRVHAWDSANSGANHDNVGFLMPCVEK